MLIDYVDYLKEIGVNCVRIEFTNESIEECNDIIRTYYGENCSLDTRKFTFGYFKDGEEE